MRKFIEKIGMDKMAHFGIGGLVTALVTIIVIAQDLSVFAAQPWRLVIAPLAGTIVNAFVSVIKELLIDDRPDWKDMWAALAGSATVFAASVIGWVLFIASN